MVFYSKARRKCDASENRGEESSEHGCSKSFEGISKRMEASAIMKIAEDAFYNCILSLITSSATMIAQCEL